VEAGHAAFEDALLARQAAQKAEDRKHAPRNKKRSPRKSSGWKAPAAEAWTQLNVEMRDAGYNWDGLQWTDTRSKKAQAPPTSDVSAEQLAPTPPAKGSFKMALRYLTADRRYRVLIGGWLRGAPDQLFDLSLSCVLPTPGRAITVRAPLRKGRFAIELGPFSRPLFPGTYRISLTYRARGVSEPKLLTRDVPLGNLAWAAKQLPRLSDSLRGMLDQCAGMLPILSRGKLSAETRSWLSQLERHSRRKPWMVTPYPRTRGALSEFLDQLKAHTRRPDAAGLAQTLSRVRRTFVQEYLASELGPAPVIAVAEDLAAALEASEASGPLPADGHAMLLFLQRCWGLQRAEQTPRAFVLTLDAQLRSLDRHWPDAAPLYQLLRSMLRRWAKNHPLDVAWPADLPASASLTKRLVASLGIASLAPRLVEAEAAALRAYGAAVAAYLKRTHSGATQRQALLLRGMRRIEAANQLAELLRWNILKLPRQRHALGEKLSDTAIDTGQLISRLASKKEPR